MAENMMNTEHKTSSPVSRENHEKTFGPKCHYHGGRAGRHYVEGVFLCDACKKEEETERGFWG